MSEEALELDETSVISAIALRAACGAAAHPGSAFGRLGNRGERILMEC